MKKTIVAEMQAKEGRFMAALFESTKSSDIVRAALGRNDIEGLREFYRLHDTVQRRVY